MMAIAAKVVTGRSVLTPSSVNSSKSYVSILLVTWLLKVAYHSISCWFKLSMKELKFGCEISGERLFTTFKYDVFIASVFLGLMTMITLL